MWHRECGHMHLNHDVGHAPAVEVGLALFEEEPAEVM
jgi:hypothetical protein